MPLDTSVEHRVSTDDEHQVSTDDNGLFKALVNRLPESERSAFSRHQMEVMKSACKGLKWGAHPVDMVYHYQPVFMGLFVPEFEISDRAYLRPRRTQIIARSN